MKKIIFIISLLFFFLLFKNDSLAATCCKNSLSGYNFDKGFSNNSCVYYEAVGFCTNNPSSGNWFTYCSNNPASYVCRYISSSDPSNSYCTTPTETCDACDANGVCIDAPAPPPPSAGGNCKPDCTNVNGYKGSCDTGELCIPNDISRCMEEANQGTCTANISGACNDDIPCADGYNCKDGTCALPSDGEAGSICGGDDSKCLSRDCGEDGKCVAGSAEIVCRNVGTETEPRFRCRTAVGTIFTDVTGFSKSILRLLLGLSGGILLIMIIFNGYKFMTSQGDPEKIKDAREGIIAAIAGILLIIFSISILQLITVDIIGLPGFSK